MTKKKKRKIKRRCKKQKEEAQQSLFNGTEAYARRGDPETSDLAAQSLRRTKQEEKAYQCFLEHRNGLTARQLADAMGLEEMGSASPRVAPLVRKGFVRFSGKYALGPSGRKRRIMQATKYFLEDQQKEK